MSATGPVKARVLQRGTRPVVEVSLGDEIFHVTLHNEWNCRPDEALEHRATAVLIEERDRHPSRSLHDLDHQVAEPFIADMRPEPPEASTPGQQWSFQVPGDVHHRHYVRLTDQGAAGLPWAHPHQLSVAEARRLLAEWLKQRRIKDPANVPETITITSDDVELLRPLSNA